MASDFWNDFADRAAGSKKVETKPVDWKPLNKAGKEWAAKVAALFLDNIDRLNIADTGNLYKKLKYRLYYDYGKLDHIGYSFPRYGVFVEKGVGRGWPISRVRATSTLMVYSSRTGAAGRYPRPWFNPVLAEELDDLANAVAQYYSDQSVKGMFID